MHVYCIIINQNIVLLVTLADYHCLIICIRIELGTQGAETPPISLGTISNQVCTIIIIIARSR